MWTYRDVKVHWLGHDGFVLQGSRTVVIDPFQSKGDYKADLILISHEHQDHLSPEDIARCSTETTKVVAPHICAPALSGMNNVVYMNPNSKMEVNGVMVETIPAYNTNKFRQPGMVFHPKEGNRVGYIVTIDGVRFYQAGDTDAIPEMGFVDVDVALLPVSGTYVMTAEEANDSLRMMRTKVVLPMHWGSIVGSRADAERLQGLAKTAQVVILEKE